MRQLLLHACWSRNCRWLASGFISVGWLLDIEALTMSTANLSLDTINIQARE